MSNTKKFLFGFLAIAPIPLFILYIYGFFTMFLQRIPTLENNPDQFPTEFMQSFGILFVYIGLAAIITLIGIIVYILDIMKNAKFEGANNNMKVVWVLVILFLGSIGMIVYFFAEIMPRKANENYHTPPITDRTS